MDLMREAAPTLATKGFAPDEPDAGAAGCSLTVSSHVFALQARISFTHSPTAPEAFKWSAVVTPEHCDFIAQSGTVSSSQDIRAALDGFISVITTVASVQKIE